VVTIGENGITEADILVHDIHLDDPSVAFMLARWSNQTSRSPWESSGQSIAPVTTSY
jgi:hypothetical protein